MPTKVPRLEKTTQENKSENSEIEQDMSQPHPSPSLGPRDSIALSQSFTSSSVQTLDPSVASTNVSSVSNTDLLNLIQSMRQDIMLNLRQQNQKINMLEENILSLSAVNLSSNPAELAGNLSTVSNPQSPNVANSAARGLTPPFTFLASNSTPAPSTGPNIVPISMGPNHSQTIAGVSNSFNAPDLTSHSAMLGKTLDPASGINMQVDLNMPKLEPGPDTRFVTVGSNSASLLSKQQVKVLNDQLTGPSLDTTVIHPLNGKTYVVSAAVPTSVAQKQQLSLVSPRPFVSVVPQSVIPPVYSASISAIKGILPLQALSYGNKFMEWFRHTKALIASANMQAYIENDYPVVMQSMAAAYPQVAPQSVKICCMQQSSAIAGALRAALGATATLVINKANMSAPTHDLADATYNAYLLWNAIIAHYAPVTAMSSLSLNAQMHKLFWHPKDSPNVVYGILNRLVDQLTGLGEPPSNSQQVQALMSAFPNTPECNMARMTLTQNPNLTVSTIIDAMENLHSLWKQHNTGKKGDSKDENALAAVSQSQHSGHPGNSGNYNGKGKKHGKDNRYKQRQGGKPGSQPAKKQEGKQQHQQQQPKKEQLVLMIRTLGDVSDSEEAGDMPFDASIQEHAMIGNEVSLFDFCLDSGATRNVVCHPSLLHDKRPASVTMVGIGNNRATVKWCGDVKLTENILLSNACLVTGGTMNLVSVSRLYEAGCTVHFTANTATVNKDRDVILEFKKQKHSGLWIFTSTTARSADWQDDSKEDLIYKERRAKPPSIPRRQGPPRVTIQSSSTSSNSKSASTIAAEKAS